jgi:CheY-like chemotaxis protein
VAEPLVLVVDDSALVTEALSVLLVATGHRCTVAGSVAEAVAAVRADAPDVMLLDLTLPDGDGLEVLEQLRQAGVALPLAVALTGHDDATTRARCLAAGCREVLTKPVPAAVLLRGVREWTASGRTDAVG